MDDMTASPKEIFERYISAGITRNADAMAEMFAPDGVFEAPLVPPGSAYPRRLEGRDEIRHGFAAYHRSVATDLSVDIENSRYVLHLTEDPDVFIAEIDTAVQVAGTATTMSLVHIYRMRDGQIALLRDYFAA
jgi:ketosteroid isomerase-like protein